MQILYEADALRRKKEKKEKENEKRRNKTQLVSHAFVLERLPASAHAPSPTCDFERQPLCLHPAQRNVQFSTVGVWKLSEKDVTLMI